MTQPIATDLGLVPRLVDLARSRSSGVVKAQNGKLVRLFCVDGGSLVHAASNMVEEQLDEFLVRRKLITPGERSVAKHEAAKAKGSFADFVTSKGFLDPATMQQGLESHVSSLVAATIDWPDGEFLLSRGRPKLGGITTVNLEIPALVLHLVRECPRSLEAVRERIGPAESRFVVSESARELITGVALGKAATFLLQRCDGTVDVSELVGQAPASGEEVLRAIYALLMFSVLRIPETAVGGSRVRDRVTRDEVLARIHRAEAADHYAILGVERSASDDEIRRAYYMLARRFHPDRFRAGDLQDLLLRIESFFTQVTEAYNTLHDTDLRAQYDIELEQRADDTTVKKDTEPDKVYLARQNFARAVSLLDRRSYQQATTFLENAIGLDPSEPDYHLELGRVLCHNPRRRGDAETALLKVIDIDPSKVDAYVQLGQLYLKIERDEDAAHMFRETLRWEPGHLEATSQLKAMGLPEDGGLGGMFGG